MKIILSPDTRLLPFHVYRTRYANWNDGAECDCTNGGVSAKNHTLYVPNPRGHFKVSEVDANLIFLPEHRGGNYHALVPYVEREGMCGPMAGGNLAATTDSRGGGMIYHVHDRFETWADYRAMSRG
jgi:hypothetical protein